MGIESKILFDGVWYRDVTKIYQIPTSFNPSDKQANIVQKGWENRPNDTVDLPLWRFESFDQFDHMLAIKVSRSSYKWHFVLRDQKYQIMSDYPNPLSVTTILLTSDKKLVLGIRKGSDQGGMLHFVGGGFIEPFVISNPDMPEAWSVIPEHPFETAIREIQEETSITLKNIDTSEMKLIGGVWGSNHDTSLVTLVPISIDSESISIRLPEHSQLIPIDYSDDVLSQIIEMKHYSKYPDYPATDHCILSLQISLKMIEKGII